MTTPMQNPGGTSEPRSGANGGELKEQASQLKEQATQLAGQAKEESKRKVETVKQTGAESIEKLARSARAAASELEGDDVGQLSQYISTMADGLSNFASRLRDKNGEEIAQEVGRLARENPGLFLTGSIVLGFGLARFARATSPENRASRSSDVGSTESMGGASAGSDLASSGYGAASLNATGNTSAAGASVGADYAASTGSAASTMGSSGSGGGMGAASASSSSALGGAGSGGAPSSSLGGTGSTGLDSTASMRGSDRGESGYGGADDASLGASTTTGTGASGIGSGTTGLNNYSPGSNLASASGTTGTDDEHRSGSNGGGLSS